VRPFLVFENDKKEQINNVTVGNTYFLLKKRIIFCCCLGVVQEPDRVRHYEQPGQKDEADGDLRVDPGALPRLPLQQDWLPELYPAQSQPQQNIRQGTGWVFHIFSELVHSLNPDTDPDQRFLCGSRLFTRSKSIFKRIWIQAVTKVSNVSKLK
jgi:hypothetical protein